MTIIDIDNIKTWPKNVLRILESNTQALGDEARIENYYSKNNKKYEHFAPEKSVTTEVKNNILKYVYNKSLLVHHATRLDNVAYLSLCVEGLRGFDRCSLLKTLYRLASIIPEIKAVEDRFDHLVTIKLKDNLSDRYERVCLGYGAVDDNGVKNFLRYGGECIREVLYAINNNENLFDKIIGFGDAYFVKADLPIEWVEGLDVKLSEEMRNDWLRMNGFDEGVCPVRHDITVFRPLPRDLIIDIQPMDTPPH